MKKLESLEGALSLDDLPLAERCMTPISSSVPIPTRYSFYQSFVRSPLKKACLALIPASTRASLRRRLQYPPVGSVDLGDFRTVKPISRKWGFDRGLPIDRYFIENYLSSQRSHIRGRVLEIGDGRYTKRFGGAGVEKVDILNYTGGDPSTTIVADLVDAPHIEDGLFDCIIATQTLQFVTDPAAAMATLRRILKPGGVLFLTAPTISQLETDPGVAWHDRWRFTSRAMLDLATGCAGDSDEIRIESFGNVLAAVGFLHGLAAEELPQEDLDTHDAPYEMIVALTLKKAAD